MTFKAKTQDSTFNNDNNNNNLPGLIFDVDGVLVDSNPVHLETWRQIGREDGFDFSEELFQQTFGQTTRAILAGHWHRKLTPEEIRYFDDRKEHLYRDIAEQHLNVIPGAVEFVQTLYNAGFPLSVGSSGPGFNVDFVLDRLGIKPYLKGWVSGTDVIHGKPAPDIFLAAAEKMGMAPARCAVIDDSESGVRAALSAGMKIIGFFSAGHRSDEYTGVHRLVRAFAELSPADITALFKAED